MKRLHGRNGDVDAGASLVLAIGFIVLVGAILGGLLAFVNTSVRDRPILDTLRNRQYAADAGVEYAIGVRRAASEPAATPCGSITRPALNAVAVRVDCTPIVLPVLAGGKVYTQRNVVFTACVDTGVACTDSSAIVRAQVNFEKAGTAPVSKTTIQSWSVNK